MSNDDGRIDEDGGIDADGPDIGTVADSLAGALTPDRQAQLEDRLAADPAARALFARHAASLERTSRLLAAEPAPVVPPAVAASLDAALRAAAAQRATPSATPPATAPGTPPGTAAAPSRVADRSGRTGRSWSRLAGRFALAAVVVGSVVLAVTHLDGLGASTDSAGTAGTAALPAASAAGTTGSPDTTDGPAAAATPAGTSPPTVRPGPSDASGQGVPLAAGPVPRPAPTPGTRATDEHAADLVAADLPAAARALRAAVTVPGPRAAGAQEATCPSRPGTRTALRQVRYAGAPAWLAVTVTNRTLDVEVTRTVCGPPLLVRTVPDH